MKWFLIQWPCNNQVLARHKGADVAIVRVMENIALKRNAQQLFNVLKTFAVNLDVLQRDDCNLAQAYELSGLVLKLTSLFGICLKSV